MEMETLKRAVSISKQIEQKEQELETFKEMMNFGGALPSKIQISNANAPYMPQVIESPVVAMVVPSAYSKTQELETLKKELKLREGQVDLLLTAKSINQQSRQNSGLNKKACDCKAPQTKQLA